MRSWQALVCVTLLGSLITFPALSIAATEDGVRDAERDFKAGTPKVAAFGTEVCEVGFGIPSEERKPLLKLAEGPSRCGCTEGWTDADEAYIAKYNRRMLELIARQKPVNTIAP